MACRLRYEIFSETRQLPEIGSYISYGLRCLSAPVDGSQKEPCELTRAADVTTNQSLAQQLASRLEKGQASPLHLHDLLENFL